MPRAAAVKWAWNLSNEPKYSSMAAASSPVGLSPPSGERFFQKIEWFVWPPRLKARSFDSWFTEPKSPASRAAASFSRAVFAPLTYVAWCLEWCSSMMRAEMCGSSAA